jgi:glycolate oxidase iron-sulfur subunit
MLKGFGHLLADDPNYAHRARAFASRIRDVTEFLAEQPPLDAVTSFDLTVTLQDPCHLAHAQRIREAPRTILRRLPGVAIREMAESSLCCGSAGIYNLTHPEKARVLGERKAKNALATGAGIVVTANPGCQMQLWAALLGTDLEVRHIVEVLDRVYESSGVYNGITAPL